MSAATTVATGLPARGQVRLHVLAEPAWLATSTAQCFTPWLSEEEQERWQRFRHEADRQRFLLARALTRSVLANCLQQKPESLQFIRNSHGKPELVQSAATPEQRLKFNVSHTQGMVVLAVTMADEVGVDVEAVTRDAEMLALAERFFAESETALLRAAVPSQMRDLFFRLWTLKEAYVKARGLGLQLGLDSFAFGMDAALTPSLLRAEVDDVTRWSCFSLTYAESFRIAVAVASPTAALELESVDVLQL